jgi:hypothetical protein
VATAQHAACDNQLQLIFGTQEALNNLNKKSNIEINNTFLINNSKINHLHLRKTGIKRGQASERLGENQICLSISSKRCKVNLRRMKCSLINSCLCEIRPKDPTNNLKFIKIVHATKVITSPGYLGLNTRQSIL